MKLIATIVGVSIMLVGFVGVTFPGALLMVGQFFVSPIGLYVLAAVRIAVGFILFTAAPSSRLPKTLRALGALVIIGGLVTPLLGADRSRSLLNWWAGQEPLLIRMLPGVIIAIGAFITFVVAPRRRI